MNCGACMELDAKVPMRDGVRLRADLFLPDLPAPSGSADPHPAWTTTGRPWIEKGRRLANNGACLCHPGLPRPLGFEGAPCLPPGRPGRHRHPGMGGPPALSNGLIGTSGGSYVADDPMEPQRAPHRSFFPLAYGAAGHLSNYWESPNYTQGAFQLKKLATWGMRTNGRTAQSIEYHSWTELFRAPPPFIDADRGRRPGAGLLEATGCATPRTTSTWQQISNEDNGARSRRLALQHGRVVRFLPKATFVNFNGLVPARGSPEARQSKLICGPWPHPA